MTFLSVAKIKALYTFSVKTTNFHGLTAVANDVLLFVQAMQFSENNQELATVGK